MNMKDVGVILAAAGSGSRMGQDKLMLKLGRYTVLQHSALAFASCPDVCCMAAVTRPDRMEEVKAQLEELELPFPVTVVRGGDTRQRSVAAGVRAMPGNAQFYAIHDAARPLVTPEEIARCLADAREYGGACLSVPVKDTIQQADGEGFLELTPPRDRLYAAQTPQIFDGAWYRAGMAQANRLGLDLTDDCQVFRLSGGRVYLTQGSYANLKITTPESNFPWRKRYWPGGRKNSRRKTTKRLVWDVSDFGCVLLLCLDFGRFKNATISCGM